MPDAARKWLERQAQRDIWPDNDYFAAVDIIRRLLAECERLEADRGALVAYVRAFEEEYDTPKEYWIKKVIDARQALGAELQGEIDELPL